MRILPKLSPRSDQDRQQEAERELIRFEAKIGGELFPSVSADHNCEFFCLDPHTWVWHEAWKEKGHDKSLTTTYTIRPTGVLKTTDGQSYYQLSPQEARNLYRAGRLYIQRVRREYQRQLQSA